MPSLRGRYNLNTTLTRPLLPHQPEGIAHLADPTKRASYLADDPGLGKTLMTIRACARLNARKILVVCPASIVSQWQDELNALKTSGVYAVAVSYTYLESKNNRKMLRESGPYDVLVLDEAHYVKSRNSKRTRATLGAKGLVHHARKIMLLSGTPVLNRPAELYPVLRVLWPQALAEFTSEGGEVSYQAFAYRYCGGYNDKKSVFQDKGASNLSELAAKLEGFMLRRTVAVLGDKLPAKQVVETEIEEYVAEVDGDEHLATRRRITGENKCDLLAAKAKQLVQQEGKMLLFTYHKSVTAAFQRAFPTAPVIEGGLTSYQKKVQIKRFQMAPQGSVIIVQLAAGGTGLDGLQHFCNTALVAELDWTPAMLDQAIGRLHRLGQTKPVKVYIPKATATTLDKRLDELNRKKREVIGELILNSDTPSLIKQTCGKVSLFNKHTVTDFVLKGNLYMTLEAALRDFIGQVIEEKLSELKTVPAVEPAKKSRAEKPKTEKPETSGVDVTAERERLKALAAELVSGAGEKADAVRNAIKDVTKSLLVDPSKPAKLDSLDAEFLPSYEAQIRSRFAEIMAAGSQVDDEY